MLHKEFWGLLFLGFVFWVMVAASPSGRIENACRPVAWVNSVVTSMSAMVVPAQQKKVEKWFDKLEYGCRYTVWRLFYQDAYNNWKQQEGGELAPTPAPPAKSADISTPLIEPIIAPGQKKPAPANQEGIKK